uniref:Uncharacterized protein n=1 Tax=Proboscia inermis TaxID=420281 RepID=A0A7S0GHN4_9STRA|mmetsp:Transcript_31866/g.36813  ORF Transcript_31866/g.36813 Transcript_31866/m.36813 type:complete len:467 (+) Transcript_31866:196-1596(+)
MKVTSLLSFLLFAHGLHAFTFFQTPNGSFKLNDQQQQSQPCSTAGFGFAGVNSQCKFGQSSRRSSATQRRRTALFSQPQNRDFYKLLGVERGADMASIRAGYRKMCRKWHPDANPGKETGEMMQDVNRAYEVLKDADLKKMYDQFGEKGIGTSAASDEMAKKGQMGGFGGGGGGFQQDVDLSDIFDSFFGGGGGRGMPQGFGGGGGGAGARRQGPAAGDDLRYDLEIDFKTAVFGGDEKVRVRHMEVCETCPGDGVKPGSQVRTCAECRGQGMTMQVTRTPLGNFQTQQVCPQCRGTGQKVDEYCGTCSGKGLMQKTKQIKVTIPPGVEDGNKLRVRGEGDAGPNGGPSGDLYIFLRVKEDKQFRREGPEVYSDTSVSYVDAILGASIKVPVVDGDVTIKVPPGTQPGQVMRLKGNGAPRLGSPEQRGDHYVTLNIDIPKKLSKRETELMEELRELQEKNTGGFFQ